MRSVRGMETNEMRGSSSSAFSASLPAEHWLAIPLYFPLDLDPPTSRPAQSLLCKMVSSPGVTLRYNDIKSL